MGLIQKVFGGIFAFVGSLFGVVGKVFGIGKKSEYFLELDDAASGAAPAKATPAPAPQEAKPAAAAPAKVAAAAPAPASTPAPAPKIVTPAGVTFAPNYLVTSGNTSRRRPGACMTSYVSMAKKSKARTV